MTNYTVFTPCLVSVGAVSAKDADEAIKLAKVQFPSLFWPIVEDKKRTERDKFLNNL